MSRESKTTAKALHKDTKCISNRKTNKSSAIIALEAKSLEIKRQRYPNTPYLTATKYTDQTTNGLTTCVIDWIVFNGSQAERINSTGNLVKTNSGSKMVPGSHTKGTADIHATIKGRSVKIEIKCEATGDRYQSDEQKAYQKAVERAGGIYLIVRDYQSFYDWFNRFVNE